MFAGKDDLGTGAVICGGMWVRNAWWAVQNHCGWWKRVCRKKKQHTRHTVDVPPLPAPTSPPGTSHLTLVKETQKRIIFPLFLPSPFLLLSYIRASTPFLEKNILNFPSITSEHLGIGTPSATPPEKNELRSAN